MNGQVTRGSCVTGGQLSQLRVSQSRSKVIGGIYTHTHTHTGTHTHTQAHT